MDPVVYISAAVLVVFLLGVISFIAKTRNNGRIGEGVNAGNEAPVARAPPLRNVADLPAAARRRGGRRRMRVQRDDSDEEVYDEEEMFNDIAEPEGKVGAKKLRKLQEKAEKKAMREQQEQEREEQKRRQAQLEELRKKEDAKRAAEEAIEAEEERKRKEEEEKREHEEYLRLKQAFTVEEEGEEDAAPDLNSESLLQEFISYVKEMKVVMLEDLAAHFKLRTQDAIDRVQELQSEGALTGVIDDRGKFIYITMEELESVAKFIRQHGRVSITELAESSNRLINLTPDNAETTKKLLGEVSA
ncbi:DDRGK domain-containing protein 1-like [Liolophura sinensis]|uniref:DDRGK domain-containing protein 1-like n=1 Tax=Liolophura sinensis TaxID=3198878 RepID=UPI0031582F49